ncbi:mitotic-spindle organizing protein 1B-like [Salvia divinorum]|uniref:Mitotic-spindle organizing protein 1B-like n=1 Tax=Salvia divinorum TaxID=28513 RepID=A0ABD1IHW0_SALDI
MWVVSELAFQPLLPGFQPLTDAACRPEDSSGMDPEAARTARDSLDLAFHMSNILETGALQRIDSSITRAANMPHAYSTEKKKMTCKQRLLCCIFLNQWFKF